MTYNEYQQYVEYATENYIKIPRCLISNYFNWEHRATLARCLIRAGKLAPAIELYKSIILVEVDNTISDNPVYSALENKVWCMEELGQALWRYEKDAAAALLYINMAIDLAQSYPWKFEFVVRGEIWRKKWEILQASGQGDIAWAEAVEKSQNTIPTAGKSNSMLFHTFSFLAEQAKKVDDLPLAISLLRKALRFFPEDYEDIKQLNAVWQNRHQHPEETYQQLYELTQHDALVWEDAGKEVPIEDDDNLYTQRGDFHEGLATVEKNGKVGFANEAGKIHIAIIYDDARNFSEGMACVQMSNKWGYVNAEGTIVKDFQLQEAYPFRGGLARAAENGAWGYLSREGVWVINPKYDFCYDFSDGLAEVMRGGKRFFINALDEIVIPFINQYEIIGDFNEGMAVVATDDKYGFIDRSGRLIIPLSYEDSGIFSEGLTRVMQDGKWGYIDKLGYWIISPLFTNSKDFTEKLAAVEINSKWGYINQSGNVIIEQKYDEAEPFKNGRAEVSIRDSKHSGVARIVIDRKGATLL